jgi:hypothetical protein
VDNIFNLKSIVMGIGTMTEDDLDLSDSSEKVNLVRAGCFFAFSVFTCYILHGGVKST